MPKYFVIIIFLSFFTTNTYTQDRITGKLFSTRSEVIAPHGMAATSHPLATQIAIDILKNDGTAVDAAIAANAALGLMEPVGCGIGGDLFAIVWDADTEKLHGLNASGRSPQNLSLDYFKENGYAHIPALGALPVSVPGCVDGWFELHKRFGKLPMDQVLSPAIQYAEEGFPVSELIAYYWELNANVLNRYENFREVFMPGGETPAKGEIFRNPDLANTYKRLASEGRDVFYKGEMARTIAEYVQQMDGFLSYDDMAAHTSGWVEPVSTNYRGYDVWELPPNGQGIAALQILNMLEGYDMASYGFGSPEHVHLFVEAKKLAFEDRAKFYADPDFTEIPVQGLISKNYAEQRRDLISMNRAASDFQAGEPEKGNTIYLTVADKHGNMVSIIQSNYRGMGSGLVPPGLGFVLQNRGELFSLTPGHANVFEPGKRPFHTIIPAFITKNGKPWISFGLMGGAMQPQGHAQIVMNLIDFGMNLQEAGDAPRIRHSGSTQPTDEKRQGSGTVYLETGFSYETIRELMKKRHDVAYDMGAYGGYQAIMFEPEEGVYFGASESRKDGQAAGY